MTYQFGDENAGPDKSRKIVVVALLVGLFLMLIVFFVVYRFTGITTFLYIIPLFACAQLVGLGFILSVRQLVYLSMNDTKMMLCANNLMNKKKYFNITKSDFSYDVNVVYDRKKRSRTLRLFDNGVLMTNYTLAQEELNEKPEVAELLKKLEEFKTNI
jgi:hypothetical protein